MFRELKLVRKIADMGTVKRVVRDLGMDVESLLPWKTMEACGIPVIEKLARFQRGKGGDI